MDSKPEETSIHFPDDPDAIPLERLTRRSATASTAAPAESSRNHNNFYGQSICEDRQGSQSSQGDEGISSIHQPKEEMERPNVDTNPVEFGGLIRMVSSGSSQSREIRRANAEQAGVQNLNRTRRSREAQHEVVDGVRLPQIFLRESEFALKNDKFGASIEISPKAAAIAEEALEDEADPLRQSASSVRDNPAGGKYVPAGRCFLIQSTRVCRKCLHTNWKGTGQLRIEQHCARKIIEKMELHMDRDDSIFLNTPLWSSYPEPGHMPIKENNDFDILTNHIQHGRHVWVTEVQTHFGFELKNRSILNTRHTQDLWRARTLVYAPHDDPKAHDPLIKFCQGDGPIWSKVLGISSLLKSDVLQSTMAGRIEGCSEAERQAWLEVKWHLPYIVRHSVAHKSDDNYREICEKCRIPSGVFKAPDTCKSNFEDKFAKGKEVLDMTHLVNPDYRDPEDRRAEIERLEKERDENERRAESMLKREPEGRERVWREHGARNKNIVEDKNEANNYADGSPGSSRDGPRATESSPTRPELITDNADNAASSDAVTGDQDSVAVYSTSSSTGPRDSRIPRSWGEAATRHQSSGGRFSQRVSSSFRAIPPRIRKSIGMKAAKIQVPRTKRNERLNGTQLTSASADPTPLPTPPNSA
ncbi:uncharacterized protein RSE6_07519 [Rhynchosporium secalis]|uniref:Uncharacterized protein n=1 Tax=Rhynchosporium secalis TaxID=38038 RepID=A0A1E1MD59_RHYSE|nr:uncharacterized protein RSE6_07519 [Rhynchosporium secalis]